MVTNNSGSTVIFYDAHKYLKSGESKTTLQFRCCYYTKKCRSRIIVNNGSGVVMKNRVAHNHECDQRAYAMFLKTSTEIQRFRRTS